MFSLKNFSSADKNLPLNLQLNIQPNLQLKANFIFLPSGDLNVDFFLSGDLESIQWPTPVTAFTASSLRRDELWKSTCFEVFLGCANSESYLEINFSPSGHWNTYQFNSYREGMRQMEGIEVQNTSCQVEPSSARISFQIRGVLPLVITQIGLTAVIKTSLDATSYWALSHSGPQADFHRREDWIPLSTQ